MKASVIIPTYDRASFMNLTLQSLSKQTETDFEVIVIDDGSHDNTKEVVDQYRNTLQLTYYFQEDEGNRVSLARNEGIKRAKNDILILLDSGMVVSTEFIHHHLHVHEMSQQYLAVIGYVYGYDFDLGIEQISPEVNFHDPDNTIQSLKKHNSHLDIRESVYRPTNDKLQALPAPWVLFWTTNVSFHRAILDKSGTFNEIFDKSWGMEDIEFAYRLFRAGCIFTLARDAAGIHYPHERNNETNFADSNRNRITFYNLYPSLEAEIFIKIFPLDFNAFLEDFLKRQKKVSKRELVSNSMSTSTLTSLSKIFNNTTKNILFGCQDGFLLQPCHCHVGTEYNPDWLEIARKKSSNVELRECIGLKTSFNDNTFDNSILAYSEKRIPMELLEKLIPEAKRIAKKTYWLVEKDSESITSSYIKAVTHVGDKYNLCEIS